jgi:hypothetical protein
MTAQAEPGPTPATPAAPTASARRRTRALAVAAAAAASVLIWLVTVPLLGHDLTARDWTQQPMEIGVDAVIGFALTWSLAGWALLALLERFIGPARRVWTITALVVLALSFTMLTDASLDTGERISLGLMHLAVGAVLIPPLARSSVNSR